MWNTDPVIVVTALAAYGFWISAYAMLQAWLLRTYRKAYREANEGWGRANDQTRRALEMLQAAQRNDNRNSKGQYAKATLEEVCVNPANYPNR